MTTETTEEHIAEQLPFDETAPEPDTKAGGRFVVAVLILTVTLVVVWGLLGLLYSSTMAENRTEAEDFRLTQVNAQNATYLNDYREYQPADNETKLYQVPVARAQQILLDNPSYLSHMPGTTANTAVPSTEVQLPVPPSLPQETTDPAAAEDENAEEATAPSENEANPASANDAADEAPSSADAPSNE